jgi:hypothetical protein
MWKLKIWLVVLRCLFEYAAGNNVRWVARVKASRLRERMR